MQTKRTDRENEDLIANIEDLELPKEKEDEMTHKHIPAMRNSTQTSRKMARRGSDRKDAREQME